mmetsp:Transcript_22696/g.69769  ORF Transcript_22696/g.69769 Transcript_22696/m.69769 type:complete len:214 (-) Transcript_22696:231-872(-)
MPWVKIEKEYAFQKKDGSQVTLEDLFGDKSQLIVVHFMFGEDWDQGCKSCSYLADMYDRCPSHLAARDVAFVVASSAAPAKLEAYKKKLGWSFTWVSAPTDFSEDFGVRFTQTQVDDKALLYNFGTQAPPMTEAPGMSVFYKNQDGQVFHTYSAYSRGLDIFMTAYHFLDTVPKGRDEDQLDSPMTWIKRRTDYSDYVAENWWAFLLPYGDSY